MVVLRKYKNNATMAEVEQLERATGTKVVDWLHFSREDFRAALKKAGGVASAAAAPFSPKRKAARDDLDGLRRKLIADEGIDTPDDHADLPAPALADETGPAMPLQVQMLIDNKISFDALTVADAVRLLNAVQDKPTGPA